jgi:hypothetical protein
MSPPVLSGKLKRTFVITYHKATVLFVKRV